MPLLGPCGTNHHQTISSVWPVVLTFGEPVVRGMGVVRGKSLVAAWCSIERFKTQPGSRGGK